MSEVTVVARCAIECRLTAPAPGKRAAIRRRAWRTIGTVRMALLGENNYICSQRCGIFYEDGLSLNCIGSFNKK